MERFGFYKEPKLHSGEIIEVQLHSTNIIISAPYNPQTSKLQLPPNITFEKFLGNTGLYKIVGKIIKVRKDPNVIKRLDPDHVYTIINCEIPIGIQLHEYKGIPIEKDRFIYGFDVLIGFSSFTFYPGVWVEGRVVETMSIDGLIHLVTIYVPEDWESLANRNHVTLFDY